MFLLIIAIAIALVVLILLLPSLSGLTKVSVQTHPRHKKDSKPINEKQTEAQNNYQYGYVPPDELTHSSNDLDDEGFLKTEARALKEKLQVHSDDIPIKIRLKNFAGDDTGLRRRKAEKLDLNTDPDSYDYDLDELIAEETESARQNVQKEFYKGQKIGGEKEEMV
ncbi:hypothetical protein CANMA_002628 [Candida margitis]|uniref:uncharacterized protein n=1 Tax=Candida margitis TaxID=1775924 RepID=UPI002226C25E|nr:uncharacterized protein CANMA_002628 [Candida margitis]KAI5967860.1 hypothetical protein CANMA_002628 [Candida margitis]